MSTPSLFDDRVTPSLFEGINARYYRASEVAKSFVPNQQYENLLVRQHSLVVGPRGSGKTTLLRMLHPECLSVWDHVDADSYRERVQFQAVYVATDRVWREQVDSLAHQLEGVDADVVHSAVVALDVMGAFIRTFRLRAHQAGAAPLGFRPVVLDRPREARLVAEISRAWGLDPLFDDLGSLQIALRRRRGELRYRSGSAERLAAQLLSVPRWDDAALVAIEAFEHASGLGSETWALLFDELEIAPAAVRQSLLESTRGMDPRLILKCSLSPWLGESPAADIRYDGTLFNDYNLIRLSYGKRAESYEFSRNLIRARLAAAGRSIPTDLAGPIEDLIFGQSKFSPEVDMPGGRTGVAYEDDAPLGQVAKELAQADPQFRVWLTDEAGIDVDNLSSLDGGRRAATLRKARNHMVARLEFRKESGKFRSRKTFAMYAGGSTMLDICEGNPRLLLGILLPLLDFFDGVHPVDEKIQGLAIEKIALDFEALIDAIPVTPDVMNIPELGRRVKLGSPYSELVRRLTQYFQDRILRGKFEPQPPTTFRVPSSASPGLQTLIGRLANVGGLVLIADRGISDVLVTEFDQQRLRLCYLLAARKHLPPNVDRPISLLSILERRKPEGRVSIPGLDGSETDDDS